MFMTAISMFCSRKRKWFRCNVAEIAGTMLEIIGEKEQCKKRAVQAGMIREKCRIRHRIVRYFAPEPAFGLSLNLPWGTSPLRSGPHKANVHWTLCAPLEPWHVNGVSNPAKCPPDIPSEDLLIDQDAVLHLYKGALHSLIYPLLIYQPEMLWLILFMERRMKKGVKNLCENEIIR